MTRAFVTGLGGQDGGYLAERLLADGVEVHGLVREAAAAPDVADVVVHRGDLTRTDDVRSLMLDLAPDEIYNLAALSSVARSWAEPEPTAAVNGTAAVALLETAHRLQERTGRPVRFLQASSAEIFGSPDRWPQDEQVPIRPINPYGAAKAYAHLMCGVYRHRGLHAATAILFSHESPRRPTRFVARKITSTVAAIARGEDRTLRLGNADVRRDWGWAPDYVDAMVLAARTDRPDDFVVATGVARSVRDFAAAAFRHAGITGWEDRVATDTTLARPADATDLVGDPRKAEQRLGWRPTVGFEELVARMVDHDLAAS